MKTIVIGMGLMLATLLTAQAQDRNLGIRVGGGFGPGAEISYQHGLGSNRLEFDLGLGSSDNHSWFNLVGTYQWVFPLEGRFNWYPGVGAAIGSWSYKDKFIGERVTSGFNLGVVGIVGIEYNFDIPLQLSLDFRPEIGIVNAYKGFNGGFGLGIRYRF